MSRSRHQRHPICRNHKCPRSILGITIKDGYKWKIYRHIKLKPYGRKNFIGYGGDEYSTRFGEYYTIRTNKKMERRLAKKSILDAIM